MNSTLTLVRYAKVEKGWRRGKIVKTSNGKIKHPYMLVGGQEIEAPQGRYQFLRYEGKRPVYTDLGNDPTQALSKFKVAETKAEKRVEAIRAAEAPEAERWLRRHRAEIEGEMRYAVNLRLGQILDIACIAEYPDPKVNEKYRIVDSAIEVAINRHCEAIGKEDVTSSWDVTVMLDVLQHLLDSCYGKGLICMPYTVKYFEPRTRAKDQAVTHETNRVHILR